MHQIPYNINMMDESGTIIASGDKERIGSLHLGAVNAIHAGHALIMQQSYGEHGQPGVNMPVFYNRQIIGVIGITGTPDKVEPLASLLSTATELLISQASSDEARKRYESRVNRFLYQWIQVTGPIDQQTTLLLEAEQLKINIQIPRIAIALQAKDFSFVKKDNDDYQLLTSLNTLIILTSHDTTVQRMVKLAQAHHTSIGIGTKTAQIGTSVQEAMTALKIRNVLKDDQLVRFDQVQFTNALLTARIDVEQTKETLRKLTRTEMGEGLLETLGQYIKDNGNMVQAAENLHIHRNTLNYRLQRLADTTHLDPKNTVELFQLYVAWLYLQFE